MSLREPNVGPGGPDDTASSPAPVDPIERIGRYLLLEIGEDPDREGLRETPARYARWWREFMSYEPGKVETVFKPVQSGQFVAVTGIRIWSICEHHLLPFSCTIGVGYLTHAQMLGLSKFGRIAQAHAHRLQVQERLVSGMADEIEQVTSSPDVAVVGHGEHLCMTMRGVRTPALMTSTAWRGAFQKDPALQSQLLHLITAAPAPPGSAQSQRISDDTYR